MILTRCTLVPLWAVNSALGEFGRAEGEAGVARKTDAFARNAGEGVEPEIGVFVVIDGQRIVALRHRAEIGAALAGRHVHEACLRIVVAIGETPVCCWSGRCANMPFCERMLSTVTLSVHSGTAPGSAARHSSAQRAATPWSCPPYRVRHVSSPRPPSPCTGAARPCAGKPPMPLSVPHSRSQKRKYSP